MNPVPGSTSIFGTNSELPETYWLLENMSYPIQLSGPGLGLEAVAVVAGFWLSGTLHTPCITVRRGKNKLTAYPGAIASVYLITLPVLVQTTNDPAKLVDQWNRVYLSGHVKGPITAVTTGLIYGLAALGKAAAGQPWHAFAVAGLTTVCIIPFTLTFMLGTNNTLFAAERKARKSKGLDTIGWAETEKLVMRWGKLNMIRSFVPMTGAVIGLLATCKILVF